MTSTSGVFVPTLILIKNLIIAEEIHGDSCGRIGLGETTQRSKEAHQPPTESGVYFRSGWTTNTPGLLHKLCPITFRRTFALEGHWRPSSVNFSPRLEPFRFILAQILPDRLPGSILVFASFGGKRNNCHFFILCKSSIDPVHSLHSFTARNFIKFGCNDN